MTHARPRRANRHDRFILRQRIRPIINQYECSLPTADDGPGEPFRFVEQKRFKFKEEIRFFTDESKQFDASGAETATAQEKNLVVALFRR